MIETYIYYALLMLLVGFISMASLPKKLRLRRSAIVFLYLAFAFGSYYSFTKMLSNPLPLELAAPWDVPPVTEAEVLGFWFVEDEGIYLLLIYEGLKAPRYFRYPWNKNLAHQIQKAAEEAARRGKRGPIKIGFPFQRSWEKKRPPVVHPMPQLMAPPKKDSAPLEIIRLPEN